MSEANALFTLDGCDLIIQCSKEDKMRDICQKYATKVNENLNSLLFLYGGSRINFELKFKEQANSLDNDNNKMSILVYKNEIDEFVCPKCGERLKLDTTKIDEIISSNKNIKDQIDGIKFSIDNIIRISSVNLVNTQLKNINTLLVIKLFNPFISFNLIHSLNKFSILVTFELLNFEKSREIIFEHS